MHNVCAFHNISVDLLGSWTLLFSVHMFRLVETQNTTYFQNAENLCILNRLKNLQKKLGLFHEGGKSNDMSWVVKEVKLFITYWSYTNSVVVEVKIHWCRMWHREHLSESLSNVSWCQNVDIKCVEGAADKLHVNFSSVRLGCLSSVTHFLIMPKRFIFGVEKAVYFMAILQLLKITFVI